MLKLMHFPLRWAGSLDQGFGIPLFNFVYPLPYYFSSFFSVLFGSVWAVKTVIIISYLMGGLGIYYLFGNKNKFVSISLALIYLMTPYQFLNIFVRGALGEVVAMGILPWALVMFSRLKEKGGVLKWYHPIPLALLLIAHNFLGILFAVFLIGYAFFQSGNKRQLFTALIYSFGLASFFLIPMIFERGNLFSENHGGLTFPFNEHFVYFKQLLYSKWDYLYSGPGPVDGMSFQLGFAQIILSVLGILAIIFNSKRNLSDAYLIIAYLGSIFLMTGRSFFIWDKISILQTIQFPWRLLFMTAILSPILGSIFISRLKSKKLQTIFVCLVLALSFWNIRNYRRPMKQLTQSEYTDLYLLNQGKTTMTFRPEILPRWSVADERFKSDELLVNAGNMIIDSLVTNPISVKTTINNKVDPVTAKITILRNYYPAWVCIMDGKVKIPLFPTDDGMITMKPEIGVHSYIISIRSTGIEKLANFMSLAFILGTWSLWRKNKNQNK